MILINGQPDNRIPVTDRGLQYGDGLFETLAFRQGKLEYLAAHLQRMAKGCERLNISFSDKDKLEFELATLCAQTAEDSVIKIMLTRGSGGRGYKAPTDAEPLRIISSHPMPDYPQSCQQGITVRLCQHRLGINPGLAGIKHLNRLEQVLARSEWDDDNIREGLMLDVKDRLVEGTMSNLFLVHQGQLITPTLTENGISGIMRAAVIKSAAELAIPVKEKDLTLADLELADEVFLTNSLIGIWPVTELDGSDCYWEHGELTRHLQSELKTTER
ncbi:aminodeoxychorismate lyase [Methylophaga sp.]|uniref:aminodeoxychorismate lyase n=1 Tax=Methylophaga sp. TaxID=2024840 RepID=UPI0013FF94F0|nr:aminodeoxychorismate lyase [Methylophaga sp.]MTI64836.1 aminodeoxychorismate lyase [Methylophaga sp.]